MPHAIRSRILPPSCNRWPDRPVRIPALSGDVAFALATAAAIFACAVASPASAGGPFRVDNEGASLAAELTLPQTGAPPFAAVILVHGSGKVTRSDMRRAQIKWLRLGYAVVGTTSAASGNRRGRTDNVGVRTSPIRMPLLGRDALAVLRAAKRRRGVDASRVGFYGISQAGWIVPSAVAGARPGEVAFAVINSGPVGSVGQEDAYSQATGDGVRPHEDLTVAQIDGRVDRYAGPPGFDNLPALRHLAVPTLWLLGDADESIPVRHTLRNLRTLAAAGAPITIHVYPGAMHLLVMPQAETVPFLDDIAAWLRSRGLPAPARVHTGD